MSVPNIGTAESPDADQEQQLQLSPTSMPPLLADIEARKEQTKLEACRRINCLVDELFMMATHMNLENWNKYVQEKTQAAQLDLMTTISSGMFVL